MYKGRGRLATVSAITLTQAYTAVTRSAVSSFTLIPAVETIPGLISSPSRKAFSLPLIGLSRLSKKRMNLGIFNQITPKKNIKKALALKGLSFKQIKF
jgi:hypothetical protein